MLINVPEFKRLLKKVTLNFSIQHARLNVTKDRVTAKLIMEDQRDVITMLDVPNHLIEGLTGEITLDFEDPGTNVIPFINLIDCDEAEVKLYKEKLRLINDNQKWDLHFCDPSVVPVFHADSPKISDYFHLMNVNDRFLSDVAKIKKIGTRFNKVYFTVKDNAFFIETTNHIVSFTNGLQIKLDDVDCTDRVLLFDYKNFVNLFAAVDDTIDKADFTMSFAYIEAQKLGMLYLSSKDQSERYYLMSKKDL